MRIVELPGGRNASALGFGTAAFGRRLTRRQKVRLLEDAFDAGITYFDTAPLYGRGSAEEAVGTFAIRRRDAVAVATKVGLEWRGALRRRVVRAFDAAAAERRLHASLRALRTDHVDVLLVHEPARDDLSDALLEFLAHATDSGLARAVGVAGGPLAPSLAALPPDQFPRVVQASVDVVAAAALPEGRLAVAHSAVVSALGREAELAAAAGIEPGAVPGVCLARALRLNPRGIVLFGTRSREHLRANVAGALSASDDAIARLAPLLADA